MDNSQKSETKSSERLPQAEQEPSQVPQADNSQSKEVQFSELPEETKLSAEKLVSGQALKLVEPQPSTTGQEVDDLLKAAREKLVTETQNPTTKDGKPLQMPPPGAAPKIQVSQPIPPSLAAMMGQQSIDAILRIDSIGKKVCKIHGHNIQPMNLRATVQQKDLDLPLVLTETTIVICTRCGASLVQVRE